MGCLLYQTVTSNLVKRGTSQTGGTGQTDRKSPKVWFNAYNLLIVVFKDTDMDYYNNLVYVIITNELVNMN